VLPLHFMRAITAFSALLLVLASVVHVSWAHAEEGTLYLWNRNFQTAPIHKALELALSQTEDLYPPLKVVRSEPMEQGEAIDAIWEDDGRLDLISLGASVRYDRHFIPVRFPVYKGLLGNRVCLIRKGEQDRFAGVATAHDFVSKDIKVCQGEYWPDTDVLARNGFPLTLSPSYQELFNLLENGKCDCFLRGVQEVVQEWSVRKTRFDIEQNVLVRYTQPSFVYVPKSTPELAGRIELGLLRALDDGSYEALFYREMGEYLLKLNMPARTVIPINNPNVSDINKGLQKIPSLWFSQ